MDENTLAHLLQTLANGGWRTEELGGDPAIINVYEAGTEGDDGYLFTLTASVTE